MLDKSEFPVIVNTEDEALKIEEKDWPYWYKCALQLDQIREKEIKDKYFGSSKEVKYQCPHCGVKLDRWDIFRMHLAFVHNVHNIGEKGIYGTTCRLEVEEHDD